MFLSANDIQLGRNETIHDTAKTLSRYLDGIMIRTFLHSDVEELARHASIPIINGLTDLLHPCQILADMLTVREKLGRLEGVKLAYVGDGNNVCNSLLYGCSKLGVSISVACPNGFMPDSQVVKGATENIKSSDSRIVFTDSPQEAVKDADVIYTDTWVSMGQESEKQQRIETFMPYQVNAALMEQAKDGCLFMHCLPCYSGFEVTDDVLQSANSVIFDQAENRLHAQKAVMALLMGGESF